jgi:hypothetical protein
VKEVFSSSKDVSISQKCKSLPPRADHLLFIEWGRGASRYATVAPNRRVYRLTDRRSRQRLSHHVTPSVPELQNPMVKFTMRQTPPTLHSLSVRRAIDAAQKALTPRSAMTDASVGRSTDAAQRLSLLRLSTLLTPRATDANYSVRRTTTAASVASFDPGRA